MLHKQSSWSASQCLCVDRCPWRRAWRKPSSTSAENWSIRPTTSTSPNPKRPALRKADPDTFKQDLLSIFDACAELHSGIFIARRLLIVALIRSLQIALWGLPRLSFLGWTSKLLYLKWPAASFVYLIVFFFFFSGQFLRYLKRDISEVLCAFIKDKPFSCLLAKKKNVTVTPCFTLGNIAQQDGSYEVKIIILIKDLQ